MKIDTNKNDVLILRGTTKILSAVLCCIVIAIALVCVISTPSGVLTGWLFALATLVIGAGVLWLVYHRTEVVFDRVSNSLTLRKRMLHGKREEVIPLDQVRQADVDLRRNQSSNNRLHASYTYRLCVVTGTTLKRHRVPLSHGYTTNKRHLDLAQKINDWLGVPDAPIAALPNMADVEQVINSLNFGNHKHSERSQLTKGSQ